jgi:hypothetical protein
VGLPGVAGRTKIVDVRAFYSGTSFDIGGPSSLEGNEHGVRVLRDPDWGLHDVAGGGNRRWVHHYNVISGLDIAGPCASNILEDRFNTAVLEYN